MKILCKCNLVCNIFIKCLVFRLVLNPQSVLWRLDFVDLVISLYIYASTLPKNDCFVFSMWIFAGLLSVLSYETKYFWILNYLSVKRRHSAISNWAWEFMGSSRLWFLVPIVEKLLMTRTVSNLLLVRHGKLCWWFCPSFLSTVWQRWQWGWWGRPQCLCNRIWLFGVWWHLSSWRHAHAQGYNADTTSFPPDNFTSTAKLRNEITQ